MKPTTAIYACLSASLAIGGASAQGLVSHAAELVAGKANEVSAAYRFANVFSGTDAVITMDGLSNIELLDIAGSSSRALGDLNPKAIENAAWSPVFAGTGGDGLHYADMTVRFYANGTDTPLAPESFTSSFFGSDLSDTSGGFMMEFVQVTGASSMLTAEEIADQLGGSGQHLAAWEFNDVSEYQIRFGWQGADGPASGKVFQTVMSSHGSGRSASAPSQFASLTSVPEPSTSLLIVLSVFPLAFRRKRQEKI